MKKLIVDDSNCIGCGACVSIDPEHFEFSEAGTSKVISNDNLESKELANAIDSCPVCVIKITEAEENQIEDKNETSTECECGNHCNCNHECNNQEAA